MSVQHDMVRWGAILLLLGGIIFWVGAFWPPYKQWTTRDTGEYLSIIHGHRTGWYVIAVCFLVGITVSVVGMHLLTEALKNAPGSGIHPTTAQTLYFFGTVFWVVNIAFRLTVTVWAAEQQAASGDIPDGFDSWKDWSNMLFGVYMVTAYAAIGFLGLGLRGLPHLPGWLPVAVQYFGFAGTVGFLVRFPVFAPPLMVHLPLMILGIVLLMKVRTMS